MPQKFVYIEYRGDLLELNRGRFGVRFHQNRDNFMAPEDFKALFSFHREKYNGAKIMVLYGGISEEEIPSVEAFKRDLEAIADTK